LKWDLNWFKWPAGITDSYILDLGQTNARKVASYKGSIPSLWSSDGKNLFYINVDKGHTLYQYLLDTDETQMVTSIDKGIASVNLSPDGRQIVLVSFTYEDFQVWYGPLGIMNVDGSNLTWLEISQNLHWYTWSSDGQNLIVFRKDDKTIIIDLATGNTTSTDWLAWTHNYSDGLFWIQPSGETQYFWNGSN
jgi:Tol biopolymer transport system component